MLFLIKAAYYLIIFFPVILVIPLYYCFYITQITSSHQICYLDNVGALLLSRHFSFYTSLSSELLLLKDSAFYIRVVHMLSNKEQLHHEKNACIQLLIRLYFFPPLKSHLLNTGRELGDRVCIKS